MTKNMTWYFADQQQGWAVEVTGEGWPEYDDLGNEMLKNTHFKTEKEAWAKLLSNTKAGFSIAVMEVEHAEKKLAEKKEVLVRETREWHQIESNYQGWLATQEDAGD